MHLQRISTRQYTRHTRKEDYKQHPSKHNTYPQHQKQTNPYSICKQERKRFKQWNRKFTQTNNKKCNKKRENRRNNPHNTRKIL
ncbi:hypothetical protein PXD04_00430 [Methanosphaera sp. ISO3-F5]|uniref:hypothetical protein n=1 Tax=Methanosphaera sp. ISO3-F5 TaxID=1452353 RepID=UPI002B258AF0|nr:hypothetical protein [Methanosphaera sp. ISO3-F5]WQH64297.1 hypothetical protein PXD04_00430 [Methanosphaera sp. ISO3-F5]